MLEVMMYHQSTTEAIGDLLIDLIEYAYRKITKLVGYRHAETKIETTDVEDLDRNFREMEFAIAISCISMIRFITDHLSVLSLSVIQQLVEQCDIFQTLVPLMEEKPWVRETKGGGTLIYENQSWNVLKDYS